MLITGPDDAIARRALDQRLLAMRVEQPGSPTMFDHDRQWWWHVVVVLPPRVLPPRRPALDAAIALGVSLLAVGSIWLLCLMITS